jgi:hypothetical protein
VVLRRPLELTSIEIGYERFEILRFCSVTSIDAGQSGDRVAQMHHAGE